MFIVHVIVYIIAEGFFCRSDDEIEENTSEAEEFSDKAVNQLIIVTQTPPPPTKRQHDRTSDYTTRVKMTQELAKVINDGLKQYEQDLWSKREEVPIHTVLFIILFS